MKDGIWGLTVLGLFLLILLPAWYYPTSAVQQKTVIKTENGIPVVYNPKDPTPPVGGPTSLILKHDLTIGEETADENYMFSQLRSIQIDDQENIYALDMKEIKIKVYDKNGKFIRSFGKKGKGPGEIEMPLRMEMTPDQNIVIDDMGNAKFIFFSLEGTCLREIPLGKYQFLIRFKFDSKGCIYADTRAYEETKMTSELKKFDPNFKPVATIATFSEKRVPRVSTPFSNAFSLQRTKEDNIIWLIPTKYELTIVNSEGKPVKKIIKDYEPIKITEAIKQRLIQEDFGEKGIPSGMKFEVPSHFPPVYYFTIDDEDRLYVCTYAHEEKDGDYWPYYDVFDAEGRYMAKFCHPHREMIFTVKKNKAYCMVQESEEGLPLVKRYSMVWQ